MIETTDGCWFYLKEADEVPSPALLVYRQRVEMNIQRMLSIAGGHTNLRPHIKTHKMAEVMQLHLKTGISKFKCATVAEAEMAARAGTIDILLAYQPVGPAARRVAELVRCFPGTRFLVVVDDAQAAQNLSTAMSSVDGPGGHSVGRARLEVLIDLDIGYHRTGVPPGAQAMELYHLVDALPGLTPGGLHAYDGHISQPDSAVRAAACEQAFAPVSELKNRLEQAGYAVPRVVAGGTPTFPFHANRPGVECSPGTCVLWDAGYANKFQDLDFLPAALVLTRVVSKPGPNRLCLDLGHKAVGSEMPHPRVRFLNFVDAQTVVHSEEHMVVETDCAAAVQVGDCLFCIPWHICPTVALYSEAVVVDQGRIVGTWKVAARERRLTV